jgi:hypothetical protein
MRYLKMSYFCRLLNRYQRSLCCFNDDIQGTACIVLAGVLSAIRVSQKALEEQRFLFFGAGEAGVGIGELLASAISKKTGMCMEEARKHCYFIDSKVRVPFSTVTSGKYVTFVVQWCLLLKLFSIVLQQLIALGRDGHACAAASAC